ncbi:hypothetical protein KUCAC02_023413 [Chaenocephalus aceratus]|uniref:Uncharacterized protein n=1 Tax=Chaenocephalus aceratus TaxID=36190 RepID=A0ACB9XPY0_CHAAC|nr:hypothetical protein KUCAC02_023413 [Chaenocephalus aceratus]
MVNKLLDMIGDLNLCHVIKILLNNRRFYVQLNDQRSKWKAQKNGLPQGSVLAPLLFNIYTNDQPLPRECQRFIYADDLCITTQQVDLQKIEPVLESALQEMSSYYNNNHLIPNSSKTQLYSFHLRNRDAKKELSVTWDGHKLSNHTHPMYLGVTLDRTLSFNKHMENTKAKTQEIAEQLLPPPQRLGNGLFFLSYKPLACYICVFDSPFLSVSKSKG